MNDELAAISGKYEELVGKLQEKYGIAKEEANQQVGLFKKTVEQLKKTNRKMMDMQKALNRQKKKDRIPVRSKPPAKKRKRSRRIG